MQIPGLGIGIEEQNLPWKQTNVLGVKWYPLHMHDGDDPDATDAPKDARERPGATVLIRMAPGASYGAHRHLGWEQVLVLRGAYADELGEYHTGSFIHYPAGSVHTPVALGSFESPEGPDNMPCVLFAAASGGIELLVGDESEA